MNEPLTVREVIVALTALDEKGNRRYQDDMLVAILDPKKDLTCLVRGVCFNWFLTDVVSFGVPDDPTELEVAALFGDGYYA